MSGMTVLGDPLMLQKKMLFLVFGEECVIYIDFCIYKWFLR